MSLASAHKFVAAMKSDGEFRAAVTSFSSETELSNFLQVQGYDFGLSDLIKAMASCMAELELGCVKARDSALPE
jgi:predicted ribosomally synthesized peptide with nif11-like leader